MVPLEFEQALSFPHYMGFKKKKTALAQIKKVTNFREATIVLQAVRF